MAEDERAANAANHPYVIDKPTMGIWNLIGDAAADIAARDRADLGSLFSDVRVGTGTAPDCDVLFLYCAVDKSGRISGQPFSIHDAIRAAGAHIVVLGSEIGTDELMSREFNQSLSTPSEWPANIVVTIKRKGDHFGDFFRELFSRMMDGVSMPMAWVKLAPQGPVQRRDNPETIAVMEFGHVAFGMREG
jgi:hypothetical protein